MIGIPVIADAFACAYCTLKSDSELQGWLRAMSWVHVTIGRTHGEVAGESFFVSLTSRIKARKAATAISPTDPTPKT